MQKNSFWECFKYRKFTDNHSYVFLLFFPQHYCHLLLPMRSPLAALTDCIHNNAQIYFHISDVLSCYENITVCLHTLCIIKVDATAFSRIQFRALRTALQKGEIKAYLKKTTQITEALEMCTCLTVQWSTLCLSLAYKGGEKAKLEF